MLMSVGRGAWEGSKDWVEVCKGWRNRDICNSVNNKSKVRKIIGKSEEVYGRAHCTISLQFSCKPETALKCLFFKNTRNGLLSFVFRITTS